MKLEKLAFRAAVMAVALLVMTTGAWADIVPVSIIGEIWRVGTNLQPAPTSAPAGTYEGTFTASAVNFEAFTTGTHVGTLGDFLAFGGANVAGVTGGLPDPMSVVATPYSTVIHIAFSKTFFAGVQYGLSHDDGAVMLVGGVPIPEFNSPGATSVITNLWTPATNVSGNFDLWYMGTNANPEVLKLSYTPVPEPASILGLGTLLYLNGTK